MFFNSNVSGNRAVNRRATKADAGLSPRFARLVEDGIRQIAKLPDTTLVYPGHDYIANNLRFTLDREPDNSRSKAMLPRMEGQDPGHAHVTTLGEEKEINTFFRLTSPSVIRRLREAFPDLPENPDEKTVFLAQEFSYRFDKIALQ